MPKIRCAEPSRSTCMTRFSAGVKVDLPCLSYTGKTRAWSHGKSTFAPAEIQVIRVATRDSAHRLFGIWRALSYDQKTSLRVYLPIYLRECNWQNETSLFIEFVQPEHQGFNWRKWREFSLKLINLCKNKFSTSINNGLSLSLYFFFIFSFLLKLF